MYSVLKRSSYPQILGKDLQIEQLRRIDQYGEKGITFFSIFYSVEILSPFISEFLLKMKKNNNNFRFDDF